MTDDIHSQAYVYATGALDADEARQFEAHLHGCSECQRELAALNEVTAQLAASVAADPPPRLRAAVLAEIAVTAQQSGEPKPEADPATAPPASPPSPGRHTAAVGEPGGDAVVVPMRRSKRERTAMLVAAAAVLASVGFGGWALNERNAARDDVATARSINDRLESVLSAGDVQTVSAPTTNGAQTAVVRSQSRGVAILIASGLPTLPDGKTYQAWTIDDGGKATSAGTFEPQGHQISYELPADAVQTSTVAVTIEPAGGSDQPTKTPIVALALS
jgi:anti-sigma-K factor RskA